MKKTALIFFSTILLVVGIACSQVTEELPAVVNESATEKRVAPDQESWESVITITREGRRTAEIWAGYIALYKKKNLTFLRDSIHVDFYNRAGNHNSVLTADEGEVDNKTDNLKATGNVVVVSDSGIILETEALLWDSKQQKIISEVPVKFTTLTDTLVGESFVSDPELKHYELRNARGYSRRRVSLDKPAR